MLIGVLYNLKEDLRYKVAEAVHEATGDETVAEVASKVVVPIGIIDVAAFIEWAMHT